VGFCSGWHHSLVEGQNIPPPKWTGVLRNILYGLSFFSVVTPPSVNRLGERARKGLLSMFFRLVEAASTVLPFFGAFAAQQVFFLTRCLFGEVCPFSGRYRSRPLNPHWFVASGGFLPCRFPGVGFFSSSFLRFCVVPSTGFYQGLPGFRMPGAATPPPLRPTHGVVSFARPALSSKPRLTRPKVFPDRRPAGAVGTASGGMCCWGMARPLEFFFHFPHFSHPF